VNDNHVWEEKGLLGFYNQEEQPQGFTIAGQACAPDTDWIQIARRVEPSQRVSQSKVLPWF
jgi:hypothetical protein